MTPAGNEVRRITGRVSSLSDELRSLLTELVNLPEIRASSELQAVVQEQEERIIQLRRLLVPKIAWKFRFVPSPVESLILSQFTRHPVLSAEYLLECVSAFFNRKNTSYGYGSLRQVIYELRRHLEAENPPIHIKTRYLSGWYLDPDTDSPARLLAARKETQ